MRKAILACAILPTVALIAPLAAQARSNGDDGLGMKLEAPVDFAPTADCPTGAAIYGVALHGEIGSGTNCILDEVPADCPPGVTAQFCQAVPVRMTLTFKGGRIDGDVTIFEAWNCAAICAVDQRWSGTVTHATLRFHDLDGGSISGGGVFAFDTATGQATLDEVLAITAPDDDDD